LPDCAIEQVRYVLDRLDGIDLKTPRTKINIRYSAGWTDYIPGESLDDLLKRADDMLYANKNNREKLFVSSIVAE
jgi:PleD family two-component response regulator